MWRGLGMKGTAWKFLSWGLTALTSWQPLMLKQVWRHSYCTASGLLGPHTSQISNFKEVEFCSCYNLPSQLSFAPRTQGAVCPCFLFGCWEKWQGHADVFVSPGHHLSCSLLPVIEETSSRNARSSSQSAREVQSCNQKFWLWPFLGSRWDQPLAKISILSPAQCPSFFITGCFLVDQGNYDTFCPK